MGGGADDPSYDSFGSRWGIKGSSEVSEGLTAVYKFETRVGQGGEASQGTNQLYAGLSGGFGNLTLGKQSSAVYNHTGAIRDISNWYGADDLVSRISNALSYSYSAESFSMQVAAIMDAEKDTDGAVDQVEFGMTVGLGDIGKVAIGYEKVEDSMKDGTAVMDAMRNMGNSNTANLTLDSDEGIKGMDGSAWNKADGNKAIVEGKVSDVTYTYDADGTGAGEAVEVIVIEITHNSDLTDDTTGAIEMGTDGNYYTNSCNTAEKRNEENTCGTTEYILVSTMVEAPAEDKSVGTTMYTHVATTDAGMLDATATITPTDTTYGHKASHISASFGLAGITVALGHTTKDSNSPMMNDKMKTNFLGVSGGIGDTGLSWNAWGRNVKNNGHKNGDDRSPWTVGLAKSLGGGATTFIEHKNADDGEDGTTSIAFRVDF